MVETPELLQFPYSHFNEKARWALDLKRVPHTRRSLLPGPHAVTVQRLTGQTTVPVLRLGEEIIDGSARIIDTLEKHWPGERGTLSRTLYRGAFPLVRGRMRLAMGITDQASIDEAAAGTEEGLDFVATKAGPSGHLVGDSFTVADLAAAALLAPAANPPDSPMSRPEPIPISIQSWHVRWEGHPGIEWVLRQYRESRPPSAELGFE
ncbi:MAG: glutathione S-transferase N-terminal domain-containing protein [Myxococcota bacterium]